MKKVTFKSLAKDTWRDFEKLFGEKGACAGCWCMYWRLQNKEYKENQGAGNKKLMKKLVSKSEQIGLIMYERSEPIGWCSVAPREDFVRLANSRVLKPVDDEKVWSIACFFIHKNHRKKGYSVKLLEHVIDFCRKKKVKIIEGYPIEPKQDKMPNAFAWTGFSNAFLKAGFKEVARRSETRPIMRYYL